MHGAIRWSAKFAAATCVLVLTVAMIGSHAAASGDAIAPATSSAGMVSFKSIDDRGIARLSVDLQEVAGLRAAKGTIRLNIPIDASQNLGLDLERFEVLSPDARFIRAEHGREVRVGSPRIVLLRGKVAGESGSHAYLALNESGGGFGSITRGDGSAFRLATEYAANGGSATGLLIHREEFAAGGDASDAPVPCGTADTITVNVRDIGHGAFGAGGTTNPEARGPRALVLAVEADKSYSNLFLQHAQAEAYVVELAGAVSDIYLRELNFSIVLAQVRTHPAGGEQFSADNLGGFGAWWPTSDPPPGIDIVHMLSGRRDLSYGGIAYLTNACSGSAFGISGFILGDFPSPVTAPNLGNWDVVVMAHEIGHNLGTPHTWDYSPPIDQCFQGVEERGTIMSYCHTRAGGLLNIDMRMHATVAAFIANTNAGLPCLWHDCNLNGVDDLIDIAQGDSADANSDGIPDSCQDCNGNGVLDPIEIASSGGALDINGNGVPDACEDDCNSNGVPDQWEIDHGMQQDVDGDGRPDSCEADCNGNGVADFIDIRAGTSTDADRNSRPDECQDCNSNGVPDWIDMDRQFNWFIGQADPSAGIREYHRASGVGVRELLPFGGGGNAINRAYDLCFGPDRQLYVASFGNSQVLRINVDTGGWSVFIAAGSGGLGSPAALAFGPDGHLYISNQATNAVLRFNGSTGAPMGQFVAAGSDGMNMPWGLAFDASGRLWVACGDNRMRRYSSTGTPDPIQVFVPPSAMSDPRDLVILPGGDLLVTNNTGPTGGSISRFTAAGGFAGKWNDNYPLSGPWGITLGPNGNVYAARSGSDVRVIEYGQASGRYIRSFIRGDAALITPTAFAIRPASPNDSNGNAILDACENFACIGDVTADHVIDINDLVAVITHWGQNSALAGPADVNHDNIVDIDDLVQVIIHWGACP